jgi:exosortase
VSTREAIARNTFWYGLVTTAGLVAGLLMSVVLARGLGPARMGDFSYVLWLERTFTALATVGFALGTVRYTAASLARGEPAVAGAFLRLFARREVVFTSLVIATLLPFVLWLSPADLRWPLLVVTIGLYPVTLEAVYSHALYGAQRYDLTTRISTLKMTLNLLAAALAMALGADILGLVIAALVVTVISCTLQRRQALKVYPQGAGVVDEPTRQEVRGYLIPLSIVAVLDALVWDRSEVFFLRLYATSEQIAFYSVAFGLSTRGMVLAEIAVGALLPALASLYGQGDRAEFGRVYRAALRGVVLVGAPIAALGAALAPGVVTLLYGEPYRPVAWLLGPMLAVALVGVMRQVAWAALRASGDRRWALNATLISAALNVAAAALLVPRYGMWGAVIANAAAQLTASALAFVAVTWRQGAGFPVAAILRILAAAVAAFAAARMLTPSAAGAPEVTGAALGGLVVFFGMAFLLRVLSEPEVAALRAMARTMPISRRFVRPVLVVATIALLLGLYAPVLRQLTHLWATVPYYSYGFLIPAFTAYGVWDARRDLASARPAWSWSGLGLLALGLMGLATGSSAHSLSLEAVSLPVVLSGAGLLVFGHQRFRPFVFPIAFLALMAPLPDGTLDSISLPLQQLASWFAGHALPLLGVPAVHDGLFVHMPMTTLHVTEACNGLRFLLAMIVIGAAFAWATQTRLSHRAAVVALAIATAIAANLIRVTGTGVIAHYAGPAAASGVAHIVFGKVVYIAMLVPFVIAVLLLRRASRRRSGDAA